MEEEFLKYAFDLIIEQVVENLLVERGATRLQELDELTRRELLDEAARRILGTAADHIYQYRMQHQDKPFAPQPPLQERRLDPSFGYVHLLPPAAISN